MSSHERVSIYKHLPGVEAPRDLTREELALLAQTNIWPAADHFWKDAYKDPDALEDLETVMLEKGAKAHEGRLELRLYVETQFPLDDNEQIDESTPPDILVGTSIELYREDITELFRKSGRRGLDVWQVGAYEFPLDGSEPVANSYYVLKHADGEDIEYDRVSKRDREFLKKISRMSRFALDRSVELNTQDAIDIHNILLTLNTPEGLISLI